MIALLILALFVPAASASGPETCDRQEELRAAVHAARRHPQRDEELQALAYRMDAERRDPDQTACAPYFLRTEALALLFAEEYVEALATMDRLLAEYADLDADLVARTQANRGYLLTRLGRTADAALAYAAAAQLVADLGPRTGARILIEAGKTYRLLRQPDAAATYLEAAAELAATVDDPRLMARVFAERAMQGAGNSYLLTGSSSRSRAEATRAMDEEALGHALRALELYATSADDRYPEFNVLLLIGQLYLRTGDLTSAEDALEATEALLPQIAPSYPTARVLFDTRMGQLRRRQSDQPAAHQHFRRAVRESRRLGESTLEMTALLELGDLVAEADLDRATRLYREAIEAAEVSREALGFQDWSVSAFELYQGPYRRLVRSLIQMGEHEEAFVRLDAVRARYLRDLRTSAAIRRTLGPEQQAALASQYDRLQEARALLADPALDPKERARLEYAAAQVQADIEAISGIRPAPPRLLSLSALQGALARRGQHLVTYFLDAETPVAFVVRPDTFAMRPLPATPDDIAEAAGALDALWSGAEVSTRAVPLDALHHLYTLTFEPVADLLPVGEPVVVIPEGTLGSFPFSLLVEEPTDRFAYADAPFLLHRHPLSTELAAGLLAEPGPPPLGRRGESAFVAFGRSRFEGAPHSLRSAASLGPLPFVPEELERVSEELGGGQTFLDESATEHALDQALPSHRLLHLATHVRPDIELPLYSHAILWDDPDAEDDGVLHAYEIENRLLDLDLVVLSGCETGRGHGRRGEGMQSLQYAFRAAGARSTVATLWQVDDRATAFIMDRLYHHLGLGARKDVALQQAQADYLAAHAGALASPALWAAPVLYGDPSALAWTDGRGGALGWVLLALGALVLATLPFALRRRARRSAA